MRALDALYLTYLKVIRLVVNGASSFGGLVTAALGLTVTGAGLVVGAPTGGDKGANTANIQTPYFNGVAVKGVVQVVSTQSSAVASGSTTIPDDDTIPQNTEGNALAALDTAITPLNAANTLIIEVLLEVAASTAGLYAAALFQDAGANAINSGQGSDGGTGAVGRNQIKIRHVMAAGTTSATTFKVRYGGLSAMTLTINGSAAARKFGGVLFSSMTITEISA